jgi:rare lipoprotein A (peptidoglycan hydrolase)
MDRLFCSILSVLAFATAALPAAARDDGSGVASFYPGIARGGELTAAHRSLPFGTYVRVTKIGSGKSVIVRINDRGPFIGGRIIDVSRRAAEYLNMIAAGLARVKLEVVENAAPKKEIARADRLTSVINGGPAIRTRVSRQGKQARRNTASHSGKMIRGRHRVGKARLVRRDED